MGEVIVTEGDQSATDFAEGLAVGMAAAEAAQASEDAADAQAEAEAALVVAEVAAAASQAEAEDMTAALLGLHDRVVQLEQNQALLAEAIVLLDTVDELEAEAIAEVAEESAVTEAEVVEIAAEEETPAAGNSEESSESGGDEDTSAAPTEKRPQRHERAGNLRGPFRRRR